MQNQRRVLLVIDSHEAVRLMLERTLSPHFSEVILTADLVEAIRDSRGKKVTHLISAYLFGKDSANGFEMITYFRALHPTIVKAVIYTGADTSLLSEIPATVYAVIAKPGGTVELINALLG